MIADRVVDGQRSYITPSARGDGARVNELFEDLEESQVATWSPEDENQEASGTGGWSDLAHSWRASPGWLQIA